MLSGGDAGTITTALVAPVGLPVRHFNTDRFALRHRHEAWRTQDWPRSSGSLLDARAEGSFTAQCDSIAVGPLTLLFGHYSAQTVTRSRERLRANSVDHLNVSMLESGSLSGDWAQLGPGELGVLDLAQQFAHRSSDMAMINFAIPRPLALAHGIDPRTVHGTHVAAPEAALLLGHLRQIRANAANLAPAGGDILARTVIDLLALALSSGVTLARPPADAAERTLRVRAEQLIASAVHSRNLGVPYLCAALAISRSALYRLFEADGGVQARIRTERLRAARTLLADPSLRVGVIAERLAFADAAHFSRSFRAEFGESPRDFRMRTLVVG